MSKSLEHKSISNAILYGVMCIIYKNEIPNTLKYEMSVESISEYKNGDVLLQVNKISKTYINDEEVNEIADELAEKTARSIFPLILLVNNKREWKEVYNAEEIRNRWQKNKALILEEYQGEFVEQYLSEATKKIESKEQLKKALEKDFFLCSFFNPLFHAHQSNLLKSKHIRFPILKDAENVTFSIQQNQYAETDELDLMRIEQNGVLYVEEHLAEKNTNQLTKKEGYYKSIYNLNAKHLHIDSAIIECSIQMEQQTKVIVLISAIEDEKRNAKPSSAL